MDPETLKLLQSQSLGNASSGASGGLSESLGGIFAAVTVLSIIITIIVVVFWFIGYMNRRKTQKAILEIRDILVEMNTREKMQRISPPQQPLPPQIIADVKGVSTTSEAPASVEPDKTVEVL